MNMNKYVKTLIKKYKNPSIIGEKSIEEVIAYLQQTFVIKDITQQISEEKIYVYIDETSGYIESNCSGLFTELALYKGISQYDYDNNTDKLIEYLTHCKDWEEIQ